ncbi:MAG TPA: DUF2490 domain-containing protein [Flavitalea sp.]|nr:DUF2490 domain-containing protein [Flavitalea sp.]
MRKITTALLSFLLIGITSFAQTQFSGWLASFNTFSSKGKTSIHLDVQLRSSDEWKEVQTFLARTGLNLKLRKNITATIGYAYISNRRTITGIAGYAPEHRIWQQLLLSHNWKRVGIAHRFRLEQRFISRSFVQNGNLENSGNVFANRFRYFIRGLIPFNDAMPFSKGLFAALQNELFLNLGDKSPVNGKTFDQNRAYIAVGYRLKSSFDIEAGYLNQYIEGRNGITNNHVIQLATYLRL